MSNNELEKSTREILGNTKSATAKALVILSISVDNMTNALVENQKKVEDRINQLETKTEKRFDKLKFFEFLGTHGWIAAIFFVCTIILIIWSVKAGDPATVVKTLK